MSLIPNDEDRARQAGFLQGAAMAEAENARLRAEIDRLRRQFDLAAEDAKAQAAAADRLRGALTEIRDSTYRNALMLRAIADRALAGATDQPSPAHADPLGEIRARDRESGALWFTGPASFTAQAARDRRELLAFIDRWPL